VIRAVLLFTLVACGGGDDEPLPYPEDYRSTFVEVRNCRNSIDHDLMRIRVLAAPDTLSAYMNKTPFPDGALLIKEEFSNSDSTCSGPLARLTVMQKLPVGSSPATLDWTWYDLDGKQKIETIDEKRCISCHTSCGKPPEGYDGTCTMP
jgi:hypothetical protein